MALSDALWDAEDALEVIEKQLAKDIKWYGEPDYPIRYTKACIARANECLVSLVSLRKMLAEHGTEIGAPPGSPEPSCWTQP